MKTVMKFVSATFMLMTVPHLGCHVTNGATMSDYKLLAATLFTGYQKELRPMVDNTSPTNVYLGMKLASIQDLDEINQQLTFTAYLDVYWWDPNLQWNPASYNGTKYFTYPQSQVWIPDLTISNSVETLKEFGFDRNYLFVENTGTMYWLPGGVFKTSCDVDVTYYPFDTQSCDIIFTTLSSTKDDIDLEFHSTESVNLEWYSKSGTWDLNSLTVNALADDGDYTRVAFTAKIRRLRTYYVVTIVMPVIFLCFTASLVFALPADSGEKMGTSITVLLAFAVYLTIVSDQMPKTSLQVSLLAIYLTLLLGETAMGVVLSVWVLNLHFRDNSKPPGRRHVAIARFLQKIMCKRAWSEKVKPAPEEDIQTLTDSTKSTKEDNYHQKLTDFSKDPLATPLTHPAEPEMTWQMVAYTFDRFLFYLFTFLLAAITVIFLTVMVVGSNTS